MDAEFYIKLDQTEAQALAWFLNNQGQADDGSFSLKIETSDDEIIVALDGSSLSEITDRYVWEFPERFGAAGYDDTADD
jgi:hypothetical protein